MKKTKFLPLAVALLFCGCATEMIECEVAEKTTSIFIDKTQILCYTKTNNDLLERNTTK
jgi:hypothetical protein